MIENFELLCSQSVVLGSQSLVCCFPFVPNHFLQRESVSIQLLRKVQHLFQVWRRSCGFASFERFIHHSVHNLAAGRAFGFNLTSIVDVVHASFPFLICVCRPRACSLPLKFWATHMLKYEESGAGTLEAPPLAAFRRSGALWNVLSWARWGEANPCFSPTLPPQGESRTRINDRSRLLVCGFHWDAGATSLITELHGRIRTWSLWRLDSIKRVVPDHRFRHCSTSTRSLSVAGTTPADDGG